MITLFGFITALSLASFTSANKGSSRSRLYPVAGTTSASPKTFQIQDFYQGEGFFDNWYFFDQKDPSRGSVNYQNKDDARNKGLAYVQDDNALVLRVDFWSSVPAGGKRDSIRMSSYNKYNGGLFVLDAAHMPVGCGVWPSFWTVGPGWPMGGEIDIVEGVNNQLTNQYTLHSGIDTPCKLNSTAGKFTGRTMGIDCFSNKTHNAGCAFSDHDTTSFGNGFNAANGGVFAFLWENSGMSMWHFTRSTIPSDLTARAPVPSTWGTPVGYWSGNSCDIAKSFYDNVMVINTNVCGSWATGAYSHSGCPGICTQMVANNANFENAHWIINYVAVYQ